jgi:hypothetical protein
MVFVVRIQPIRGRITFRAGPRGSYALIESISEDCAGILTMIGWTGIASRLRSLIRQCSFAFFNACKQFRDR